MKLAFITPVKDVHGKTPLDYALEGGNGKVATLFQELQNVDAASREKPKAIDNELVDGFDFPDEVPDFLSDANVSFCFSGRFITLFRRFWRKLTRMKIKRSHHHRKSINFLEWPSVVKLSKI